MELTMSSDSIYLDSRQNVNLSEYRSDSEHL